LKILEAFHTSRRVKHAGIPIDNRDGKCENGDEICAKPWEMVGVEKGDERCAKTMEIGGGIVWCTSSMTTWFAAATEICWNICTTIHRAQKK
jgi:hypothetical protein